MVIIDQKTFNKDIGDYISTRRSLEDVQKKVGKRVNPFKKPKKEEELKEMEEELEELEDEEETEYTESVRQGVLSRFFKLLRGSPKSEYEEYEEQYELDEDIKEALKISFGWLQSMPADQLKKVKTSGEFQTYKDALMKYGLVKEK